MKKSFVAFLIALGLVAFGGKAFAANGYYVDPNAFYMHTTDSNGGTNVVGTFTLNQTPWLHVYMPENSGYKLSTAAWSSSTGSTFLNSISGTSGKDLWFSLGNWNSLTADQKTGLWKVESKYSLLNGTSITPANGGATYFNVVAPEPISALLFMFGGLGLGVRRMFRKS